VNDFVSFEILIFKMKFCSPNVEATDSMQVFMQVYQQALNGESKKKLAFFVHSLLHAVLNKTVGRSLPRMQNERMGLILIIYSSSNNMLMVQLNQLLSRLVSTGIVKHHVDYGYWYLYRPVEEIIEDPRRILSLTDLQYGFVLWLVACLVSFVCFICELLWFGLKKLPILFEVIEFLIMLRSRMHDYHDKW
jgi:hypothetical protein